jgi:pSer/pThr/pTyr-binding forkhead associated (FHA) protein
MDQVIWVEILSRHREVAHRVRCPGPQVLIGRGYDNDVVVDDPYVAPRHVRVFRDEAGRLIAEDAGSRSGLFLDRDKTPVTRLAVDGERPIRIGHTYLRIRQSSHVVPPERAREPVRHVLPVILGVALIGLEAVSTWLSETGEPRASNYLLPLLTVVGMVAGWVSAWALLSRIFSGAARLERNLTIALTGLLAFSLFNEFAQYAAFALTWRVPTSYGYVAMWCMLATACFFHLREVGPSHLPLKASAVLALAALAIGVQTLTQSEAFRDSGRQTTVRRLLPPALRLAPVRDESTFFGEIEQLKTRLDRDRSDVQAEEPVP